MLKLGTARHHDLLLRGITSLDDIGCFALTELGFGAWPFCRSTAVLGSRCMRACMHACHRGRGQLQAVWA